MSLLANFPLAVTYEAAFRFCVRHVRLACANEQVIRIDAKRIIATVASIEAFWNFNG